MVVLCSCKPLWYREKPAAQYQSEPEERSSAHHSGSLGLSCAAGLILADLYLPNYFLSFPDPITVSSPVDQYRRVFLLRLCHSQLYTEGSSRAGEQIEEIREKTYGHQQIHGVKFSIVLTHYQSSNRSAHRDGSHDASATNYLSVMCILPDSITLETYNIKKEICISAKCCVSLKFPLFC